MRIDNVYTSDKLTSMAKALADHWPIDTTYKLTIFPYKDPSEYQTLFVEPEGEKGTNLMSIHTSRHSGVGVTAEINTNDMGGVMQKSLKDAIKAIFNLEDRTYAVAITRASNGDIIDVPEEYLNLAGYALEDAGHHFDNRMWADLAVDYMEMQEEMGLTRDEMKTMKHIIEKFATQAVHTFNRWRDVEIDYNEEDGE